MNSDKVLAEIAGICGVIPEFTDLGGATRQTDPETQRALIRATGLSIETDGELRETLAELQAQEAERILLRDVVILADQPQTVACDRSVVWQVVLEEKGIVFAEGRSEGDIRLPALPLGVHDLLIQSGIDTQHATLIAAPLQTPSLRDVAGTDRTWGVVAALYGLTSQHNLGVGNFEDLSNLGEVLGATGAGFVGINPVHVLGWAAEETFSPYSPSHRGFLNSNHISLDHIPHCAVHNREQTTNTSFIDYFAFGQRQRAMLRAAFEEFQTQASPETRTALAEFTRAGGQALADFALFETLSETMGADWRKWEHGFQTPNSARTNASDADSSFHVWLQWLAACQLEDAHKRCKNSGMGLGLYLDLAVGARLDGAEAWGAADCLARGVSLGAPPDHLSPAGQNWQLAAYAPGKLAAQKYQPLRQILRQAMRSCGVLRIDHALGLNRSYWIPENGAAGGYIRQPFQSLLALISLEAHLAGTVIVGEDLGLVPDGFREKMASRGFYGYTVVQYEKTENDQFRKTEDLRPQTLACFGTHDTPTITGFWEADDIDWWHRLGWIDTAAQADEKTRRQSAIANLMGVSVPELNALSSQDLAARVHGNLAEGPTALVAVQLDDVIGVRDAQNLPGTIDEHPNWRRKTPISIPDLAHHRGLRHTAKAMASSGRSIPAKTI
ncbi:4-alpha-glucanotransferase [Roseobacter sp.]|uniref:4-alpha-glucanotransferase n=1 Tax=Roseobacter sp. TaxID=1907202 RepID=UPI0038580F7F